MEVLDLELQRRRLRGGWYEDLTHEGTKGPIGIRNTWSNLAYLLAGIFVVLWNPAPSAVILGLSLAMLAVGSAWYHSEKTLWSAGLDWAGMYATFGSLAVYGIAQQETIPVLLAMMVVATAFAWAFNFKLGYRLDEVVGGLFMVGILAPGLTWWSLLPFSVFALAYFFWLVDKRVIQFGAWGDPPITGKWGHALWHVITAIAIVLLYMLQVKGGF